MKTLTINNKLISIVSATLLTIMFVFSSHANAATKTTVSTKFDHTQTGFILKDVHLTLRCEQCHVDGIFKNTPKDCSGCHAVGTRVGATPQPINHVQTTAACDTCHTSTANFQVKAFNHLSVTNKCSTCHNSQSLGVLSKPASHIPTNLPCEQCHKNTTTFVSWQMGTTGHAGITSGCYQCHGGPAGEPGPVGTFTNVVSFNAATHIPITVNGVAADCNACHTGFTNFLGAVYNHASVIFTPGSNSTPRCSSCHSGQTVGVKAVPPIPANHITIPAGNDCSVCHFYTTPGGFLGATYNHAGVQTGSCDTCHTGAYPGVLTKGSSHITTQSYKCDACHTSINTLNYTSFAGSTYHGAPGVTVTAGSCSTCHDGSKTAAPELAQGLTSATNHIPTSNAACDVCHTSTNTSQYSTFKNSVYHQTVLTPGTCTTCHNGNFTAWNALGMPAGTGHIPTTASCDSCHTAANTQNYTAFTGAIYHQVVTNPGTCITCHTGTFGSPNSALNPMGMGGNHITQTDTDCAKCHTKNNTSNYTVFTGALYHQGVTSPPAGGCLTCHDGSKTSENAQGKSSLIGLGHIPTTASPSCDTCHTSINTIGYTTFQWAEYHEEVPLPGTCITCHTGTFSSANSALNPQAMGPNHITPTDTDCGKCHTKNNTSNYTVFTGTRYHQGVISPGVCNTCHDGSKTSEFALGLPAGNAHIPTSGATCDTCHSATNTLGYTTFQWAVYHQQVTSPGTCTTCHTGTGAGTYIDATAALNPLPISTPHIQISGYSCGTCHTSGNTNGYNAFTGASYHLAVSAPAGGCLTCHNASLGVPASGNGLVPQLTSNASGGHITVTGTSCDLCHTAFNTSYFTSFTGTTYHGSVNATGTLCSSCHSGTTATLSSNGLAPQTSLQALNLSGLDHTTFSTACETCHTSSNTSQFSTFLGATYHPTGAAATGTCANAGCHVATNINPSGPLGINYQLVVSGIAHQITGASCETCHTTYTTFLGATIDHSQPPYAPAANNCSNCHNGIKAKGMSSSHLPTTAQCDTCHTAAISGYLTLSPTWGGAGNHGNPANNIGIAGTCGRSGCHDLVGGVSAQGAKGKPTAHLTTSPITNACDTCHTTSPDTTASYTTWLNAKYHTIVSPPATCGSANCHDSTATGLNTWGVAGKNSYFTHITTAATCDTCHTPTNTATYTTWLNAKYHANTPTPGTCGQSACHDSQTAGLNASGASGKNSYFSHITTTATCDTCHTPSTTATYTTWLNAKYHANVTAAQNSCGNAGCHDGTAGPVASGAAGKNVGHLTTTAACDTCHTPSTTANYTTWLNATYHGSVTAVAGTCANAGCHDSTATGLSTSGVAGRNSYFAHITTTPVTVTNCDTCHTTSTTAGYTTWLNAKYHTNATAALNSCGNAGCHDGTAGPVASGAAGKNVGHLTTTAACDTCHTTSTTANYTTWLGATYHSSVTAAAGTCANTGCHDSTASGVSALGVAGRNSYFTHITTTPVTVTNCDTCHTPSTTASYTTWLNAKYHTNATAAAGSCGNTGCHDASAGGLASGAFGLNYYLTHISATPYTTAAACDVCHTSSTTANYTTWLNAKYHNSSVTVGTCNSTGCHDSSGSGLNPSGAAGPNSLYTHIPTSPIAATSCNTCHTSANTATYTTWLGAKYHLSVTATAGSCGNAGCHDGSANAVSAGAYGKNYISTHVVTSAACDSCHTSSTTASYTTWLGAVYAHDSTANGVCQSCHNGINAYGQSTPHISASGSCDSAGCHSPAATVYATANVALGYPNAWAGAVYNHPGVTVGGGTCSTCHGTTSTTTPVYPGVSFPSYCYSGSACQAAGPFSHQVTAAACDSCHKSLTTWTGAGFAHNTALQPPSGAPPGSCVASGCHGPTGGAKGLASYASHISGSIIPSTMSCDNGGCHKVYNGTTVTTFAGGILPHTLFTSLRCDGCHGGLYTTFGTYGALGMVSNHIPIAMSAASISMSGTVGDCNVCHKNGTASIAPTGAATSGATAWATETVDANAHGNGVYTGGGTGGIYCVTCHLRGVTYLAPNIQQTSHNGASTSKDCSRSSCHQPLGSKGTAYTKWK